jgi:hypothetical protein
MQTPKSEAMNIFDLPHYGATPKNISFFGIDMDKTSSSIRERMIGTESIDESLLIGGNRTGLERRDAVNSEGALNIYIYRFEGGKCFIDIFGKVNNKEFKTESEIGRYDLTEFNTLNKRIKYTLSSSRTTLKRYYHESNLKAIQEHLVAFLFVF